MNRCKFCGVAMAPNEADENGNCALCAWYLLEPTPPQLQCPHGNPAHACDACDVASDLAFDAAREG